LITKTAWDRIQAGIDFALDLPLLVMLEKRMESDADVLYKFIYQIYLFVENEEYKSEMFLQPLNEWYEEVIVFRRKKAKNARMHLKSCLINILKFRILLVSS
jgi:hypothetical protein